MVPRTGHMDEGKLKARFLKLIGASAGASANELHTAYLNEVKKGCTDCLEHNPELKALASQRLEELKDTYECLTEPEKLRKYITRSISEKSAAEKAVQRAITSKTAAKQAVAEAIANKAAAEKALGKADARKTTAEKAVLKAMAEKVVADSVVVKAGADKAEAEAALTEAVQKRSGVEASGGEMAATLDTLDPANTLLVEFHSAGEEKKNLLRFEAKNAGELRRWGIDLMIVLVLLSIPILAFVMANTHVIWHHGINFGTRHFVGEGAR